MTAASTTGTRRSVEGGERGLQRQIDREIGLRDRVVLVCSKAALEESEWVRYEFDKARAKEAKDGKAVLFPIVKDDALFKKTTDPMYKHLRNILVGDFRKATKGKAFDRAVSKLIDGLRKKE